MTKRIAWVGTGFNSTEVLRRVLETRSFNITLLVRGAASDYSEKLPTGILVKEVDYSSHSQLVGALQGNEIVIVFTRFLPGHDLDTKQIALINAAIDAKVKYFIPSEWAPDTAGVNKSTSLRIGDSAPTDFALAPKRAVHNYLLNRAGEGKIGFAVVYCGVIIQSGEHFAVVFESFANISQAMRVGVMQFDFENQVARLPDGGIHPFSSTSLQTLGKAVISLLSAPETVNNMFLHISDGVITCQDVLRVVEEETGKSWRRENFSLSDDREVVQRRMREGVFTPQEFFLYIRSPFFSGISVWNKVENELLGISQHGSADLREEVRRVVRVFNTAQE